MDNIINDYTLKNLPGLIREHIRETEIQNTHPNRMYLIGFVSVARYIDDFEIKKAVRDADVFLEKTRSPGESNE